MTTNAIDGKLLGYYFANQW